MSYILDALRKSEHERQRQAGPAIADLRATAPRSSFPIWAIAVGALLAVNLIVILVLVIRSEVRQAELSPPPSASTSIVPPPGPVDLVAEPALPLNSQPRKPAAAATPTSPATEAASVDPELRAASVRPSPKTEPASDANLPKIDDLNLQGANALPELRLDIHVYAQRPADRFVFINMHKYREGEQTLEGIKVERITVDGVVLNARGKRFLLPRQ